MVTDNNNDPLADVVISSSAGQASTTDANGNYTIGLLTGTYSLTPSKVGYTFSPISRQVSVPPRLAGQDFGGAPTALDSYEPDDNSTVASLLESGSPQAHTIFPATDIDWATFSVNGESEVIVQTSGPSGDTQMWLYNDNLGLIESDDNGGNGSFSKIDRLCDVDSLPSGTSIPSPVMNRKSWRSQSSE